MTRTEPSREPEGVVEVDPCGDVRWKNFVTAHPEGLIYHHPLWLQVLEQAYGYECFGLAYQNDVGELEGVLPVARSQSPLTGHQLSSLPRTPVAGPLALDTGRNTSLVEAAVRMTLFQPGTRLQLKSAKPLVDVDVMGLRSQVWDATYILMLPDNPMELRFGDARNHSRIRWAVRKAARLGVRVRPAEKEDEVRSWYDLYLDTMRWHAIPPRPYRFFEACWKLLGPAGHFRLLLAEYQEGPQRRLLAGSVFFMAGQTIFYAFNGRRRKDLSLRPNDAIHWRAIHDACYEGFRRYDFGEVVDDNRGLAQFKSKWSAEPSRLYRYYYPTQRELETGLLRPGTRTRRVVDAAWRRLPIKGTAVLGDFLHRF